MKRRKLKTIKNRTVIMLAIITLVVIVLIGFYLSFARNRCQQVAKMEALQLAYSVKSLLPAIQVSRLVSDDGVETTSDTNPIGQSLSNLIEETDSIDYAYILKRQSDSVAIAIDSAGSSKSACQAVKYGCEKTARNNFLAFESGESYISDPISTPCGKWISVQVPIYDSNNTSVIAALGLVHSEAKWRACLRERMALHLVISGLFIFLVFMLAGAYYRNKRHEKCEKDKAEHKIARLRDFDGLTGLHNRKYMEQEIKRLDMLKFLPLSFVICDIDGLGMVNDAYGYEEGDRLILKVTDIIRGCIPDRCLLGYSGGGEFVLLSPNTNSKAAHHIKSAIKGAIKSYNESNKKALYAISVSIGHSTKDTFGQQFSDTMRAAKEYLNHRKLLNQNSLHSSIVSSIMATLHSKSQETEEHGQRLGEFCQAIGKQLNLQQESIDDLHLLSKLHDIGKIGIDDYILNKPGALDEKEWEIMKKHPEIGYRIAMTTPQLKHIAEYILYHHERWDGAGYPMGLCKEEIPVISRILAIADAYDAMTEDRVYRKAISREEAIEEIERNAGTQFDPDIARLFIGILKDNKREK